ncbi:hypothetical protein [Thermorudis peleae]|uniref:hypothetical protein n=1 Tax=Thermorudis peleae TaxID=1382356 RepID=UPI00056DFF51|nr:hypothetical protein [Thermorudis peleae]
MEHDMARGGPKRPAFLFTVGMMAVIVGLLVAWPAAALAAPSRHVEHQAAAHGAATVSGPSSAPASQIPTVSSQQKAWIIGGIVAVAAVAAASSAAAAAVAARRSGQRAGRPRGWRWWR